MSSEGTPVDGTEGRPMPNLQVMGQYIKDLSFETPHAPDIFALLRTESPEIPIGLDTNVRHMGGTNFEVAITVSASARLGRVASGEIVSCSMRMRTHSTHDIA